MRLLIVTLIALIATTAGCARAPYKQVLSQQEVTNSREYAAPVDLVYQAALRVLYSRNYVMEKEDPEQAIILGKRMVQRGQQTYAVIVQAKVVDNFDGTAKLFINGVQTTDIAYVADKTRFLLFVIPLPGGGGKEVTSTRREETYISDQTFYKEIFNDVGENITFLKTTVHTPLRVPAPVPANATVTP